MLERDALAQHRVRAERHADLPARQSLDAAWRAPHGGWRPVSRAHKNACGLQQGPGLDRVLLREHAGGRHHARLHARIGHGRQRKAGDRGLSRPHITEEQAIHHAVAARHVPEFADGGLLLRREREGKRRAQGLDVRARRVPHGRDAQQVDVVAQAKRELQV